MSDPRTDQTAATERAIAIMDGATTLRSMHGAYMDAGFTDEQALRLCIAHITASAQ